MGHRGTAFNDLSRIFYGKTDSPAIGGLTIRLVNDKTGSVAASTKVSSLSSSWQSYTFTLKTATLIPSADYHLQFLVEHPGVAWFSLISLFPPTYKNEPNGKRVDLMEKLAALHPAFLRFPGGNYLEGEHPNEHYEWKKTIGPLVDRPTHPTPWTYRSSDGMGLLEFLTWCEDLHMEPLLAVHSGYALNQENIAEGKDLEPFVQDALDEIEYVSGNPQPTGEPDERGMGIPHHSTWPLSRSATRNTTTHLERTTPGLPSSTRRSSRFTLRYRSLHQRLSHWSAQIFLLTTIPRSTPTSIALHSSSFKMYTATTRTTAAGPGFSLANGQRAKALPPPTLAPH